MLGATFGTSMNNGQNGWTGFIQTAGGFNSSNVANGGTLYDMYWAEMLDPGNFGCQSGRICITGIWAGIGGYVTQSIFGPITGALAQSGVAVLAGGNAFDYPAPFTGPGTYLFYEYTGPNGTPSIAQAPAGTTPGDDLGLWGWLANSSRCDLNDNGNYACFSYDDYTQNWGFGVSPLPWPGTAFSYPTTVEFEWNAY